MKSIKSHVNLVYLAVLLFVTIVPACKTISSVQFQALEAPQIILPLDLTRIAFVDRNQYFPADSIVHYYSVTDVSFKDSIDITQNMSLNCYQGFVDNLSEYWVQDSIPFVRLPLKIMPDTTRYFTPLSWEIVNNICTETQTDALVVLEDIQVFNNHSIEEADEFWALTEIYYSGIWRIYDPLYKKIYDDRLMVDSLFLESSDSNLDRLVNEKLLGREQILNDASYILGESYVELISPKWIDISRDYFVSGDKRLSMALYFMEKNDFDSAINMWKSLTQETDMKLAGRAAYNLAVVHEMKGDLKSARGWIRKAIYFYKNIKNRPSEYKEIEAYTLILNTRWINGQKIKRFFGEDN